MTGRGAPVTLAERLRTDETLFTAWSGIPDPLVVETLARSGFDVVTLDMQHGFHSTDSVLRGIAAAKLVGTPAVVRVPVGRFDMASRALDFGASAVIAPMINSLADAKAFAAAMKYPPLGERSWGPSRALALHGHYDPQAYLTSANHETVAFAMIETRAAFAILDDILGLDGIDGVFLGPADFSIALSNGARVDPVNVEMMEMAGQMAAKARAVGKLAAAYGVSSDAAQRLRALGFRLIALTSDISHLVAGATAILEDARRSE